MKEEARNRGKMTRKKPARTHRTGTKCEKRITTKNKTRRGFSPTEGNGQQTRNSADREIREKAALESAACNHRNFLRSPSVRRKEKRPGTAESAARQTGNSEKTGNARGDRGQAAAATGNSEKTGNARGNREQAAAATGNRPPRRPGTPKKPENAYRRHWKHGRGNREHVDQTYERGNLARSGNREHCALFKARQEFARAMRAHTDQGTRHDTTNCAEQNFTTFSYLKINL